jgi:hypothetical protein
MFGRRKCRKRFSMMADIRRRFYGNDNHKSRSSANESGADF